MCYVRGSLSEVLVSLASYVAEIENEETKTRPELHDVQVRTQSNQMISIVEKEKYYLTN